MGRLIILAVIAFAGFLFWQEFQRKKPQERKKFLLRAGFWVLLAILVLLAVTGRMHWIGAAIAALIPLLKGVFNLLVRFWPFLAQKLQQRQQSASQTVTATNLTEAEAWQILGLQPGASKEDIIQAHKKLIQKLHPDRGGNDYLAARINQAKDLLIKTNP